MLATITLITGSFFQSRHTTPSLQTLPFHISKNPKGKPTLTGKKKMTAKTVILKPFKTAACLGNLNYCTTLAITSLNTS